MKITIPYRRSRIAQGIAYTLSSLVLLVLIIALLQTGSPAALGCALISLLFFAFPCWMALNIFIRAVRKTGCFSITSDGVENLSHPLSVGCFGFPVTVRLIPWSCIDSFRLDRTAGGERLLLIPKDIAEFPKGYSPFVRSLLEREQNRGVCGFSFDSRAADANQEELLRLLQRELEDFRRRGYPSGWPEAVPPVAQENTAADEPDTNNFH